MNNIHPSSSPSNNILLFFMVMLAGFSLACGYHALLNSMGMAWPWNTFLFSPGDRFNDWHNSIAQAASINPYYSSGPAPAAYFPLTYVLLNVGVGYSPATSIYIYLSISIALIVLTAGLARAQFRISSINSTSQYAKDVFLLAAACFFSFPVIFALDRGNIDIWIAFLSVLFVVTQRTRFEMAGLFCLSLAISLKGYPAVLLLLLVSDRQYFRMLFCSLLALLMSVITLYFMWDGFNRNLSGFLNNLNLYYRVYVIGGASLFASSDPYNASRLLFFELAGIWQRYISPSYVPLSLEATSTSILKIYSLLSASFVAITALFVLAIPAARWKKVTAICLIALMFPNVSNDYKLCFLFPGLYLFLMESEISRSNKVSFALFCLLMIPKSYFFIHGKPISMLINPLLLIALAYQVMGDRQSWRQGIRLLKSRFFTTLVHEKKHE